MAKSLRSKSKRAFRRTKREDPKSDYHIRDKLRLQRLSEKLKVLKSVSDDENEEDDESAAIQQGEAAMAEDGSAAAPAGGAASQQAGPSTSMETDEVPKKVSTSGPRESSNTQWRLKTGLGPKKRTSANSTTFAKPKQYKSPGRAKRARN